MINYKMPKLRKQQLSAYYQFRFYSNKHQGQDPLPGFEKPENSSFVLSIEMDLSIAQDNLYYLTCDLYRVYGKVAKPIFTKYFHTIYISDPGAKLNTDHAFDILRDMATPISDDNDDNDDTSQYFIDAEYPYIDSFIATKLTKVDRLKKSQVTA